MLRYVVKRLILTLLVIVGIATFIFIFLKVAPGDVARTIIAEKYCNEAAAQEGLVIKFREKHGLELPLYVQYYRWLIALIKGDLGYSLVTDTPVIYEIAARLPATISLAVVSMLISLFLALSMGIILAVRRKGLLYQFINFFAIFSSSVPAYVLGLLLILVFSVTFKFLPFVGFESPLHLVLPSITLGVVLSARPLKTLHLSMVEVLEQDYIRLAKAKGLPERLVILKHTLRNSMVPFLSIIGLEAGHLMSGVVVVETVFSWPGVGKLLMDAVFNRDYPLILGCVIFGATSYCIINLLTDILCAVIDPRIRLGFYQK